MVKQGAEAADNIAMAGILCNLKRGDAYAKFAHPLALQ